MQTIAPPTSTAPSTSSPSSSGGGVTLEAIMAQLVHMDARLDTLSDELCHVKTHVNCIMRRQAMMGGYTTTSLPTHLRMKVMASIVLMMIDKCNFYMIFIILLFY